MSKAGFMRDAVILFVITLVSDCLLGGVYQVTKEPISQATIAANSKAYRAVFNETETFESDDVLATAIEDCNADLAGMDFEGVAVKNALKAVDDNDNELGYVITSLSNDSYGGAVKLSVGLKKNGTIAGIELLEINSTPGLGLKTRGPTFKDQFTSKDAQSLGVTESGNTDDTQISTISGATITSSATTNAVNAALYYLHNCVDEQEVG